MSTHGNCVVLVGGHESAGGKALTALVAPVEAYLRQNGQDYAVRTAGVGRSLHVRVTDALDKYDQVVVVPMTFGLNPTLVADCAKTLRWLARDCPDRIVLTDPFAGADLLGAWLRQCANNAVKMNPDAVLLIIAPKSNPFDEAQLHRIAYLVGTHSAINRVQVVVADSAEQVKNAVRELQTLGYKDLYAVTAGFSDIAALVAGTEVYDLGALMSPSAVAKIVHKRIEEGIHLLSHGDNGIEVGLEADHGHGYAHSHAFEEGQSGHSHSHGHSHGHGLGHTH